MSLKDKIKVLLIEENEDHRLLINNVFVKQGDKFELFPVQDLKTAEKYIDQADIIITNLSLPDGSGVEFLRNSELVERVPIIILESFIEQETIVKLLKAGLFDYVNKSNEAFNSLPERVLKYIELMELKKERKKIVDQQNMLSIAIKHSSEGIVVTDTKGIIEFVNPALEKVTGYKSEELIGKTPGLLKSGQHDEDFYKNLWNTIKSGKPWKGHFINKKKDGTLYEEDASISPVFNDSGEIINFVALKRDVSEMIKIENQLRHAQKMEGIGTLAAGIAHEINTPLQYLYDNTLFVKDSFGQITDTMNKIKDIVSENDDPALNGIRKIIKKDNISYLFDEIPAAVSENIEGIKIVRKIVMAMKNFSHPGLKSKQRSDLNSAIISTIAITKNVWKYTAEVNTELDEKLPEVNCHIGDINQVFLNMITNASDAIAENKKGETGKIDIKTYADENNAYVSIRDDGGGIPENIKDKIFQPFFTTKEIGKGTGQGLALSYDIIINKHKGSIDINTEEGKGTEFIIKLPVE